jgi:alanine-synthesizing transaminase
LFVHGSGFTQRPGTHHFRIVFLPPPETLANAFDLVDGFVKKRFLAQAAV